MSYQVCSPLSMLWLLVSMTYTSDWLSLPIRTVYRASIEPILFGYDNENNVVLAELGLDNNSFYKHQIPNSLECKCGLLTVSNFLLLYYSQIISDN